MRRMVQRRIFFGGVVLALSAAALGHGQAKKAGSAGGTGSVAGSVSCADTNAPARFAVVTLERVPEEVSESAKKEKDEPGMNATATTDMEGRFLLEKVAAGRYYVVGSLAGYLNPLTRFGEKQLKAMSDDTRKELAKAVPIVSVEANQSATANLRLERASELSGTVLYDDGSPAIGLEVALLRKDQDGKLTDLHLSAMNGAGLFGSTGPTDDRGHYRMIGATPGEYAVRVSLPTQKISLGGLLSGGTSVTFVGGQGEGLSIYLGGTFRKKDAKIVKVGEGEQVGGLDLTIAGDGLHSLRGTVVAKLDGHPVSRAHVELLYADDRELIRTDEIGGESDEGGSFEFSYVPAGRYILRLIDAVDTEKVQQHEFNSDFTFTDERVIHKYDVAELPVMVQGDVSGVELAAPEIAANKPPSQ